MKSCYVTNVSTWVKKKGRRKECLTQKAKNGDGFGPNFSHNAREVPNPKT